MRRTWVALVICSVCFLGLLAWSSWDHAQARIEHEQLLAQQVATSTAEKLLRHFRSMSAQLQAFSYQERDLLIGLAMAPRSPVLSDSLWSLLQLTFPGVGSALVLDSQGKYVAMLGDPLPGVAHDVERGRAPEPSPTVRLEDRGTGIRTEYAAPWFEDNQPAGTLLISLPCNHLCSPDETALPEGHHQVLLERKLTTRVPNSRHVPSREAKEAILLAEAPVGNTGWILEQRIANAYLSTAIRDRLLQNAGLGALFLAGVIAFSLSIKRQSNADLKEHLSLRDSRDKVQALLEATTDGIILAELNGRIVFLNPAAELTFGRLADDVLNTSVKALIPEFLSKGNTLPFLKANDPAPESPVIRETSGRRKDGKKFPLRLSLSILQFGGRPHLVMVVQDLTEILRNEQQLVFLEQRDVLTGLANRREFERRLAAVLADESKDATGPHTLCHIDVDQFKLVNDTCGHEAGDHLLRQIAILVESKFEEAEIIARLGSDEFGVLFRSRTVEEARVICEAFMQTVRHFLFTWRDQSFDVAVSIGMTEFVPDNESASSALSKAHVACQMAKSHGRDRIHVYHDDDAELTRHHGEMHLVSTISQALNDGRFHLFAQPIAHIRAGPGNRHFEILVRMVDEAGNPVIPDDFIPAAERYILMPSVDRWIINHLFSLQAQNLRAWHDLEPNTFLFAVNLSGTSVNDESFLRYLKRQFSDWSVPYASICFEITETAAVSNLEGARAFMEELSELGCSFALDDFGTGLSSYRYLKELPVDYLKIDGSFVCGMTEDPVSYALVESINQIGHVLGLKTIAEWAEDRSILNQLRALNVDFAQGYGVGEPMPVSKLKLEDAAVPQRPDDRDNERRGGTHRPRGGTA